MEFSFFSKLSELSYYHPLGLYFRAHLMQCIYCFSKLLKLYMFNLLGKQQKKEDKRCRLSVFFT